MPEAPPPIRPTAGRVIVVGIGADGWAGLSDQARDRLRRAEIILGSARQLALVPDAPGDHIVWPSPLLAALPGLLEKYAGRAICVLASGDPMFFGIGTTLVRLLGQDEVEVLAHPSCVSLACARLGWAWSDVEVVSLVGRPVEQINRVLSPDRQLLLLSADGESPAAVADLLTRKGYGPSAVTVLEQLGGPAERVLTGRADAWGHPVTDALNVVGVHCRAGADAVVLPLTPGLPDEAYVHDGQLTKRDVRAITLARLAPMPGQRLWDVGAGAGSIAIEWMRSHPSCQAIAVESRADRAARIATNAADLGVPDLDIIIGSAPRALAGLASPDAAFVGGGATVPGVIETCWDALKHGGRLVVNAVTLESERVVADWCDKLGGDLIRVAISQAAPIGGFTAFRPMLPVTQWTVHKA